VTVVDVEAVAVVGPSNIAKILVAIKIVFLIPFSFFI
jgi:hypothetical protein